jgi:hypothetical protein
MATNQLKTFDTSCTNMERNGDCVRGHITLDEAASIIGVVSSSLVFDKADIHNVTGVVGERRFSICKNTDWFEFVFTDNYYSNKNMELKELLEFLKTLTPKTVL